MSNLDKTREKSKKPKEKEHHQRYYCSYIQESHKITKYVQADVGPVIAASVSVSMCEFHYVLLDGFILVVSSALSVFPTLLSPFILGSLSCEDKDLMETSHVEMCVPRTLSE